MKYKCEECCGEGIRPVYDIHFMYGDNSKHPCPDCDGTGNITALQIINNELARLGEKPICDKELKDWSLQGNETEEKLEEYARDFHSDLQTERCDEKQAWRYEV